MSDCILVLDAMGVIYQSADDVAELLVPFLIEKGCQLDPEGIDQLYIRASSGEICAEEFWEAVGVSSADDSEYLSRHRLSKGLLDFLEDLPASIKTLWCLSNDVGAWSLKLRKRHGLDDYFEGFVISSEVGSRKPDRQIYEALLTSAKCKPEECVFVDDRKKNLLAAIELGFNAVGFGWNEVEGSEIPWVKTFEELRGHLS